MRMRSSLALAIVFLTSACSVTQRPPRVADEAVQSSRLKELFTVRSADATSQGYRIGPPICDSLSMPALLALPTLLAEGNGAHGLDGVKLAGLVIGLLLLVAAIRAIFGRRKP